MGKKLVSVERMVRVIGQLREGAVPWDVRDLDTSALEKCKRYGYLRPARFAPAKNPWGKGVIVAYALTPEGEDFLRRTGTSC